MTSWPGRQPLPPPPLEDYPEDYPDLNDDPGPAEPEAPWRTRLTAHGGPQRVLVALDRLPCTVKLPREGEGVLLLMLCSDTGQTSPRQPESSPGPAVLPSGMPAVANLVLTPTEAAAREQLNIRKSVWPLSATTSRSLSLDPSEIISVQKVEDRSKAEPAAPVEVDKQSPPDGTVQTGQPANDWRPVIDAPAKASGPPPSSGRR
jgi:hypothetical protein